MGIDFAITANENLKVPEFTGTEQAVQWADMNKHEHYILSALTNKYFYTYTAREHAESRHDEVNVSLLTMQLRYIKKAIEYLESKHVGAVVVSEEVPIKEREAHRQ